MAASGTKHNAGYQRYDLLKMYQIGEQMRRRRETTEMLKESMGDALLDLMREKPLEKISIEEMTARADVGRVTYCRYFKS